MRGRPVTPHCPSQQCRERLSHYNFWRRRQKRQDEPLSPFERAALIAGGMPADQAKAATVPLDPGERPGVPQIEEPATYRQARRNGRTVTLVWMRCPDCNHLWESTATDRPYR